MTAEGISGPEAERAIIVEALRTRGIEDAETRELLNAWLERRENEVFNEGTRESQICFEIEQADIWSEAGNADYAKELLMQILSNLMQERNSFRPGGIVSLESMLKKEISLEEIDRYIEEVEQKISRL